SLPEVARPDVMLDAVLDADPLPLETHAPLLVGVRVHRGHRARRELDHREDHVLARKHAGAEPLRELTRDATDLQVVEARRIGHGSLLSSGAPFYRRAA